MEKKEEEEEVGPFVDPFQSHVPRSLFKGLLCFPLPVGE